MQELTKAQEEILKVLWEIEEGVVNDVIERLPHPRPAYNTVSTVIKVLEKKSYASHRSYGKTYVYFPTVSKKEYARFVLKDSLKSFFNGSVRQAVSFFVRQKNTSIAELEELKQLIEKEIENQKK
ncbi:MAG: BlaI/MecI/CopY family transcriptional regulator [Bacteroidales bacterium]|jgi:predicted transcriptional regulator